MKPLYIATFFTLTLFLMGTRAQGQDYKHAIKMKGAFTGFSYKYLTGFEKGYEVVYLHLNHGHSVAALRVWHEPAFPKISDKWFVCYGYGAHAGIYSQNKRNNPFRLFDPPTVYHRTFVSTGLDGYVGLEYRVLKHPFVISADFIPNFEFFGPDYFRVNFSSALLGLSYVF
ncbi:MAG: hypothetical protein QM786_17515 [Breznakibacter sp.]